jgi:hypothetical protein
VALRDDGVGLTVLCDVLQFEQGVLSEFSILIPWLGWL